MYCKNCNHSLLSDDNFCNSCGAKVIDHRLTTKYLIAETSKAFFNIDSNKPIKTFLHLFTKPEVVIDGYINGVRKKYINAFGYFTIAITFSSLFYFVFLKFFPEALDGALTFQGSNEAQKEVNKKIQKSVFEYQSLIFFASIPLLALMSWIVFLNKKKYNYAEHLIINLYAYSQASILSIIIYFFTVWNNTLFSIVSISAMGLQILYFVYILKRLFTLTLWQICVKTLYFLVLLVPIFLIFSFVIFISIAIEGGLDELVEAEKAKRGLSYIASSIINWTS